MFQHRADNFFTFFKFARKERVRVDFGIANPKALFF